MASSRRPPTRARPFIFEFTLAYVEEGGRHFCTCNEAPVVGTGASREEAYLDMQAALSVWLDNLAELGELDRAISDGRVPCVVTVESGKLTVSNRVLSKPFEDVIFIAGQFPEHNGKARRRQGTAVEA